MALSNPGRGGTVRVFLTTLLRWSTGGAALGGGSGLVLLLVSILGERHVWAGMLLLAGVLSWPTGLWVFEPLTRAIEAGVRGATFASLVAGPLINGAVLGATLGCIVWFGGHRSSPRSTDATGTA
jgi:hypothetical protein